MKTKSKLIKKIKIFDTGSCNIELLKFIETKAEQKEYEKVLKQIGKIIKKIKI